MSQVLSRRLGILVALAAAALIWLAPAVAHACPACAGRSASGMSSFYFMATMMLLPFGVATVAYKAIRRATTDAAADVPTLPADPADSGVSTDPTDSRSGRDPQ